MIVSSLKVIVGVCVLILFGNVRATQKLTVLKSKEVTEVPKNVSSPKNDVVVLNLKNADSKKAIEAARLLLADPGFNIRIKLPMTDEELKISVSAGGSFLIGIGAGTIVYNIKSKIKSLLWELFKLFFFHRKSLGFKALKAYFMPPAGWTPLSPLISKIKKFLPSNPFRSWRKRPIILKRPHGPLRHPPPKKPKKIKNLKSPPQHIFRNRPIKHHKHHRIPPRPLPPPPPRPYSYRITEVTVSSGTKHAKPTYEPLQLEAIAKHPPTYVDFSPPADEAPQEFNGQPNDENFQQFNIQPNSENFDEFNNQQNGGSLEQFYSQTNAENRDPFNSHLNGDNFHQFNIQLNGDNIELPQKNPEYPKYFTENNNEAIPLDNPTPQNIDYFAAN